MKKLLFLILVTALSPLISFAQAPFVVFTPAEPPTTSYRVPNYIESFTRSQAQAEAEAYARIQAQVQAQAIVSNETVSATGYELYSEKSFPMKVRIIKRRNGDVSITCIGIKKNNVWKPYNNGIASLEEMLNQATSDSDKSQILEMMELGNFLLIINPEKEVYIIQ